MSDSSCPLKEAQIVTGALFGEPMRVETVRAAGPGAWALGLVGARSERFRSVTLTLPEIQALTVLDAVRTYTADSRLLRLDLQAYRLGIAYPARPLPGPGGTR